MFICDEKICILRKKQNRFSFISSSDVKLSFMYSQQNKLIFDVFWRKHGFHVIYLCEENKSIKLQSWREELIVTFAQGIIEFAINEIQNHRKTPEKNLKAVLINSNCT